MTIKIKVTKTIGLPLKAMEVTPGKTVDEVLKQSKHFDTPGELIQCHVYQKNKKHELTILDKNTGLNSDTDLLVVSPILGAAPVARPGMSFRARSRRRPILGYAFHPRQFKLVVQEPE